MLSAAVGRFLLFVVLAHAFSFAYIEASVISNSRMELCDRTSPDDSKLQCSEKISMNLAINQGERNEIQYTFSEVNGEQIEEPLTIVVRKSVPKILYPVFYTQDYNAKPFERIVYKEDLFVSECRDDEGSGHPTCGYELDEDNQPIFGSQGFCCSCTLAQRLGIERPDARAMLDCTAFITKKSSAHCMRYGSLWYSAFEIGTEQKSFDIDIEIKNTVTQEVVKFLTLSPENPGVTDTSVGLYAKLIGDFQSFRGLPNFGSKLLMAPSYPLEDPIVKAGSKFWMFVDKSMVSVDGSECNKVGVNHRAFRNQGKACENRKMECLQNQLQDLHNEDAVFAQQGRVGKYFISNYGNFTMQATNRVLEMALDDNVASSVLLVLDAESVKIVDNRGTGRIVSGQVKTFEALSRDGVLIVGFINTGKVSAEFILTVTDCSSNINPVVSKSVYAMIGSEQNVLFDITTNTRFESSNQCTVTLMDTTYSVLDSVIVPFDTSETIVRRGDKGTNTTGTEEVRDSGGRRGLGNCQGCLFANLLCKVINGCIVDLAIVGAIAFGVIVAIIGLILFTYVGGWSWTLLLVKGLVSTCKGGMSFLGVIRSLKPRTSMPSRRSTDDGNEITASEDMKTGRVMKYSDHEYLEMFRRMMEAKMIPNMSPYSDMHGIYGHSNWSMSSNGEMTQALLLQLIRNGQHGCCFMNIDRDRNARLHALVSGSMPTRCGPSFSIAGNLVPSQMSLCELKTQVRENNGRLPSKCQLMFVIHKRMNLQVLTYTEKEGKWKQCRRVREISARSFGPIPLEQCLKDGLLSHPEPIYDCINLTFYNR